MYMDVVLRSCFSSFYTYVVQTPSFFFMHVYTHVPVRFISQARTVTKYEYNSAYFCTLNMLHFRDFVFFDLFVVYSTLKQTKFLNSYFYLFIFLPFTFFIIFFYFNYMMYVTYIAQNVLSCMYASIFVV